MKNLFYLTMTLLLLISCQKEQTIPVLETEEDIYIEAISLQFAMEKPSPYEKPVFLRKLATINETWKLITNNGQIIYLTPTLDNTNPFFMTLYNAYLDCYGVIDYIPQTNPITVIAQSANSLLITSLTGTVGETQYWFFFVNGDGNLEWEMQTFADGVLIPGTVWSMYFEPSNVDLQILNYCPDESAP